MYEEQVPAKRLAESTTGVSAPLGNHFDSGKPRFELLPPDALMAIVRVYTKGALVYGDRNWEKGLPMTSLFASAMRHAWAWMAGEDRDLESGELHLAHACTDLMMILAYYLRGLNQLDDRPPPVAPPNGYAVAKDDLKKPGKG